MTQKEYVFLEGKPFSGISKKTGNPYTLRKIKLADPDTFANHTIDFHEILDNTIEAYTSGDRVYIDYILQAPPYGGGDSKIVVIGIYPVN